MTKTNPGEGISEQPLTPEEVERDENEWLEQWMNMHPVVEVAKINIDEERSPEIGKIEEMFRSFESTYPLQALHAIINLTPDEAPLHRLREPAKEALCPILDSLIALKNKTNISPGKYNELFAKYKRLARAVGIIKNNKVDHNR